MNFFHKCRSQLIDDMHRDWHTKHNIMNCIETKCICFRLYMMSMSYTQSHMNSSHWRNLFLYIKTQYLEMDHSCYHNISIDSQMGMTRVTAIPSNCWRWYHHHYFAPLFSSILYMSNLKLYSRDQLLFLCYQCLVSQWKLKHNLIRTK